MMDLSLMPEIQLNILSNPEEISKISQDIRSFCNINNLEESDCDDIEICLIEALNNVIIHAYKGKINKNIDIKVRKEEMEVEIEICDKGKARLNFEKPKLDFDPNDISTLPEGGMGLFIIEELMDSTYYKSEDGMNKFLMKKYINKKNKD